MNKLFVENLQHCCHWTRSQCSHRKYAPRYLRAAPSKFRQVFPSLEALTIWWGVPREYNRLFGRYSWLNNNSPNLTFRWVINFGKRLTSTRIVCMYSWCNILPIISSYDYFLIIVMGDVRIESIKKYLWDFIQCIPYRNRLEFTFIRHC